MKARLFKITHQWLYGLVNNFWYKKSILAFLLYPFSIFFRFFAYLRRLYLCNFRQKIFPIPIIVVGNISVGGVGKTPLVIAIAERLTQEGFKVGIVSRGYKATIKRFPYHVKKTDSAYKVGDEPLLLAMRVNCPVVIDPNRCRAADYMLKAFNPDVIISDDGLQHYKLGRTVEIAVIDSSQSFGNGFCIPAGPLREPPGRLNNIDFIVVNGEKNNYKFKNVYNMVFNPKVLHSCSTNEVLPVDKVNFPLVAVAGIGNPDRFFKTLKNLDFEIETQRYPDHYKFTKEDFIDISKSIVMTEKDFVKCKDFADDRMFFLPISAILDRSFWEKLINIVTKF